MERMIIITLAMYLLGVKRCSRQCIRITVFDFYNSLLLIAILTLQMGKLKHRKVKTLPKSQEYAVGKKALQEMVLAKVDSYLQKKPGFLKPHTKYSSK